MTSYIVSPLGSSLWLQILLEANAWLVLTWAISYMLHRINYQRWHLGFGEALAFLLVISFEALRLYVGYTLNLIRHKPFPRWTLWLTLALCLPFVFSLWYLRIMLFSQCFWLQFIWNMWLICIGLQVLLVVTILGIRIYRREPLPHWARFEAMLKRRRQSKRLGFRIYRF